MKTVSRGCQTPDLSVLKGNPARRLYEALGFTPIKENDLEHEMRYEPGAVRPAG